MLGVLVKQLSGKRLHDLITERIWSKAGMKGDEILGSSPQWHYTLAAQLKARGYGVIQFVVHTQLA